MNPCGANLFGEMPITPVYIKLNSVMILRGSLFAIIVLALKIGMQLAHVGCRKRRKVEHKFSDYYC